MRETGVTIDTERHRIHVDNDGVFGAPGQEVAPGQEARMAFIRDSEGNLVGLASRHKHDLNVVVG